VVEFLARQVRVEAGLLDSDEWSGGGSPESWRASPCGLAVGAVVFSWPIGLIMFAELCRRSRLQNP
jgi:hypothetical protein